MLHLSVSHLATASALVFMLIGLGMACAVTEGVNKALAACGACTPIGAQRDIKILQRIANTDANPGEVYQAELSTPVHDAQGRIAHLRGIIFSGYVRITHAEVGVEAISAENLRGAMFKSMRMVDVAGNVFFDNLDARDLMDDAFFRHLSRQEYDQARCHTGVQAPLLWPTITNDYGIPAGASGTVDYLISFYFPLATNGAPGEVNPLEGLIPISAIQLAESGGLQWRWGNDADLAVFGAGSTVDSFRRLDGTPGFDLWGDVLYLPAVIADEGWNILNNRVTQQNGDLPNGDRRTEYLAIRYRPEDEAALAGQTDLTSDFDGLSLTVAGNNIIGGWQELDVRTRMRIWLGANRDSAQVRQNAADDLPVFNADGDPLTELLLPYQARDASPAGTINFNFATRGPTFTRFMHRTVICPGGALAQRRAAMLYKSADCGPCAMVYGCDKYGDMSTKVNGNKPSVLVPRRFATLTHA